jgi:colanic acid/amylovoran biosynthesis glycosyltransferase
MPNTTPVLVVVPGLGGVQLQNGKYIATGKFLSGMAEFAREWAGRLEAWLPKVERVSDNLDNVEVDAAELSFGLKVYSAERIQAADIAHVDIVLANLDSEALQLAFLCNRHNVPVVFWTESGLRTRLQWARYSRRDSPLRFLRLALYEIALERKIRRAIRVSHGIQCNGTPTVRDYGPLTRSHLLFFDSRSQLAGMIPAEKLEHRLARMSSRTALHLAFSGRLIDIKGVMDLPRIAERLRGMQIDFRLRICGDGALGSKLRATFASLGLADVVEFVGVLDFDVELQPMLQEWADLFVCPHPQADPSCTYLETLACGVPIVGYSNEAWQGMLALGGFGRSVPISDIHAMAEQIAGYAADRSRLAADSRAAIAFARQHTFEDTVKRRMAHLRHVLSDATRT